MAKISTLTALAAADLADDDQLIIVDVTGTDTTKRIDAENLVSAFASTYAQTILDDANAAAVIATLGLDADIATLSLPASTTISAYGKTLVDDADAEAVLKTLLLRRSRLKIDNAVGTVGVKCSISSIWNGDTDGATDDILDDDVQVGNYSLGTGELTVYAAALSGNCVAVLSATILSNAGGTAAEVDAVVDTNNIVLTFTNNSDGSALTLTDLVDNGIIYLYLLYITDA